MGASGASVSRPVATLRGKANGWSRGSYLLSASNRITGSDLKLRAPASPPAIVIP